MDACAEGAPKINAQNFTVRGIDKEVFEMSVPEAQQVGNDAENSDRLDKLVLNRDESR